MQGGQRFSVGGGGSKSVSGCVVVVILVSSGSGNGWFVQRAQEVLVVLHTHGMYPVLVHPIAPGPRAPRLARYSMYLPIGGRVSTAAGAH